MHLLLEELGAVFGWCKAVMIESHNRIICKDGMTRVVVERMLVIEHYWTLLYWPATEKTFCRWILSRKPLIILVGYMSRNRGLHWDRKRR